jgi:hypothetical protein
MPESQELHDLETVRGDTITRFAADPRILGIDIGRPIQADDPRSFAVRLHVVQDLLHVVQDLSAAERAGIDVIDLSSPRRVPQGNRTPSPDSRQDISTVIQPGIGISRTNGGAGTLGLIAYDGRRRRQARRRVLVSCWHILAFPGVNKIKNRNLRVVHPAAFDTKEPENVDYNWIASLGSLYRLLQPTKSAPGRKETGIDAAFAWLEEDVIADRGQEIRTGQMGTNAGGREIEVRRPREVDYPDIENRVKVSKVGRSTGLTTGVVDGIGTYFMDYGTHRRVPIQGFRIVPEPGGDQNLSDSGDSGAVWYLDEAEEGQQDPERTGVGIHFDGNREGSTEYALACHLPSVLSTLKLSLT